jgi:hypothetical protein
MLKDEVIESVKEGKFLIYAIDRVEEGIELLSGMPAGELLDDGTYPEGTFNYLVMKRLDEISVALEKKKDKDKDRDDEEGQQKKESDNGDR